MNTELIILKIAELKAENNKLWDELDKAYVHGEREFHTDDYDSHFFDDYDGESISHVWDILDEQNYILQRLENYIRSMKK